MIRKLCVVIATVAVLVSMAGCKKGAEWYEVVPVYTPPDSQHK